MVCGLREAVGLWVGWREDRGGGGSCDVGGLDGWSWGGGGLGWWVAGWLW